MKVVLGRKTEMTQIFKEDGILVPVTIVDYSDVVVTGVKSEGSDGYNALILGLGKKKNPTKAELGKYKSLGFVPNYVTEFRMDQIADGIKVGSMVDTNEFDKGKKVDISGITKGKGFQGVVKRHGFAGGPKTHGQSDRQRHPGAIGQRTTPGRVYKGMRMGGHMGNTKITVKNLEIVDNDMQNKYLLIKGAIPGKKGGILKIIVTK